MNQSNTYSHVLSLKVWNRQTNATTDYANIESKVKALFLEREVHHGWEKLVPTKASAFPLGDMGLQTNPDDSDTELLHRVCETMSRLNDDLHANRLLAEHQLVVFHLVKPLS